MLRNLFSENTENQPSPFLAAAMGGSTNSLLVNLKIRKWLIVIGRSSLAINRRLGYCSATSLDVIRAIRIFVWPSIGRVSGIF